MSEDQFILPRKLAMTGDELNPGVLFIEDDCDLTDIVIHTFSEKPEWSGPVMDALIDRYNQVGEVMAFVKERYEDMERECNEDEGRPGRDSFWVQYYRNFQDDLAKILTLLGAAEPTTEAHPKS